MILEGGGNGKSALRTYPKKKYPFGTCLFNCLHLVHLREKDKMIERQMEFLSPLCSLLSRPLQSIMKLSFDSFCYILVLWPCGQSHVKACINYLPILHCISLIQYWIFDWGGAEAITVISNLSGGWIYENWELEFVSTKIVPNILTFLAPKIVLRKGSNINCENENSIDLSY